MPGLIQRMTLGAAGHTAIPEVHEPMRTLGTLALPAPVRQRQRRLGKLNLIRNDLPPSESHLRERRSDLRTHGRAIEITAIR